MASRSEQTSNKLLSDILDVLTEIHNEYVNNNRDSTKQNKSETPKTDKKQLSGHLSFLNDIQNQTKNDNNESISGSPE